MHFSIHDNASEDIVYEMATILSKERGVTSLLLLDIGKAIMIGMAEAI